jgi:hypothetical protein
MPFKADIEVVDEDIASKTACAAIEIDPGRLVDPARWRPELMPTVLAAETAMKRPGEELKALRDAGIGKPQLKACADHLAQLHKAEAGAIAEAGEAGVDEGQLSDRIAALELAEHRKLRALFKNLITELRTSRPGTNGTRLVRGRRRMVDGVEERLDRYVISRTREISQNVERIVLDGTASLLLNRHAFGEQVQERRYAVPRKGLRIQVKTHTNSKARLLGARGEENRAELGAMIADLDDLVPGEVLVGASKKVRRKLEEDGLLEGVRAVHYGGERGLNVFEHCQAVLVAGREEMNLRDLEDQARGFVLDREAPFQSLLDQNEEGWLLPYRRRRRMADGSVVWGTVSAHPELVAQALQEAVREAGAVQLAERVRCVWHEKLVIFETSLPVDCEIDHLVTAGELRAALREAGRIAREARRCGWGLGGFRVRLENYRTRPNHLIEILLGFLAVFDSFALRPYQALIPDGRHLLLTTLWTCRPATAVFTLASGQHPGLRRRPPEHGVLRECLRRFGVVPAWADLPAMVPDLVPDEIALKAVRGPRAR